MDGFEFPIDYGAPAGPPRIDPRKELEDVFRHIGDAPMSHRYGTAHTVTVAPLASSADLAVVCDHLRRELAVAPSPVATFKRRSDKKNYRGPADMDDAFVRAVVDRFKRLRFLDGTPYEESVLQSGRDERIVLVERRSPAGAAAGQLLMAFVAVAAEPDGAVRHGRLSPSLRQWIDGPTEMGSPTTKRAF